MHDMSVKASIADITLYLTYDTCSSDKHHKAAAIVYTNIDLILGNTWTNELQNRCYMCIQWTRYSYSGVITRQSNPPISQISRPCNESTSVRSMFPCNILTLLI